MSMVDFFSADDVAWQNDAPCATADYDFIPDTETDEGLATAQQWCQTCDVRTRCLAWAMLNRAEGYWGGTTTYQRDQLRRVRNRAKCPICQATELVYTDPHELCLCCGASWIRDVREEPIAATPLRVHVHIHNDGVIGSQLELSQWLNRSLDQLDRRGSANRRPA